MGRRKDLVRLYSKLFPVVVVVGVRAVVVYVLSLCCIMSSTAFYLVSMMKEIATILQSNFLPIPLYSVVAPQKPSIALRMKLVATAIPKQRRE